MQGEGVPLREQERERRQLYGRVTWRLVPFFCLCYLAAYLDRINVGLAKLQMQQDLGFSETVYGLGAGLWTANLARAHRLSRRLRAGLVWVNCYADGDITVPFGGVKQSGFGRDKSLHALDKYSDLKTTWISLTA
jgi:hypothetical protein